MEGQFLLVFLTSFSLLLKDTQLSSIAWRIACIEPSRFAKTYTRNATLSGVENPVECISFICLRIVVLPASPAPME